jgi:2-keto-4-pentenoate hydratase/2-oxohepta-3-ene-1,7-dioic acid hydratase in catechol pathway
VATGNDPAPGREDDVKLCRFDGGYGLVAGNEAIDVTDIVAAAGNGRGDPLLSALPQLAALGEADLSGRPRKSLSAVDLLSPIVAPTKILAAPNNYREHLAEMQADADAHGRGGNLYAAGFFLKATSALVGPSEGIRQRFLDRRTDHELELVIVIGKEGTAFPMERAMDYVAGYAIGLDVTLRGAEERSLRKSIDTYAVLGPWLVTADELPDIPSVGMSLSVNGEPRQKTLLSDMIYGVAELVEYAGRFYTLYPGDLIYTGTPSGVGPIRPDDRLHAEIAGIGAMEVRVHAAAPADTAR